MPDHPHFTPSEHRVLELIRKGLTTAEMARRLRRTEATIYSHIQHLHVKLGTNTRAGLTLAAMGHDNCCQARGGRQSDS